MILRPRQIEFVDRVWAALREKGNTLGVAPTGAGKTVMLSSVAGRALADGAKSILILQHRDELVDQNRKTYHAVNGPKATTGVIDADRKDFLRPVLFGMVQTVCREANLKALRPVDVVMVDEAHHIAAKSYQDILARLVELNPSLLKAGFTATPNRGDKKALAKDFSNVADQITLGELVKSGALVRPRTFVVDLGVQEELARVRRTVSDFDMSEVAKIMDHTFLNDKIVAAWKEKAGDRQTVAFASTVAHAQHACESFRAAGVTAAVVTGDMADGERKAILAAFDRGEFQVLLNVAILTEGWDCQPVSCVLLLRPSSYASIMIQMIGRGLRRLDPERYPGRPPKNDCIVIDFGTSILTHGSLEQEVDLEPHKGPPKLKDCPACAGQVPERCRECALCGHVFEDMLAGGGGAAQAALPKAEADFILTEIDIFAASPFKWEELWDGVVLVATAFECWAMAVFHGGTWTSIGGSTESGAHTLATGERMLCLSAADDFMREHGSAADAGKSKRWLHQPASPKQLAALRLDPMSPVGMAMTRYQAACHMTWKFNERAVQAKLQAQRVAA